MIYLYFHALSHFATRGVFFRRIIMKKISIKYITVTAVMAAISFVLMIPPFEFPVSFVIPAFIKFDFSDLPALITSFSYGPVYGVLVCLVKNLLHLIIGNTFGVGEIANFLLGSVFVFVAGIVYKYNKTRKGAVLGALAGAFAMALISLPVNYFITYPFYITLFHTTKEGIVAAYKAIYPKTNSLTGALIMFNMPFTFVKGLFDSIICFLIYKKLSPILKTKE